MQLAVLSGASIGPVPLLLARHALGDSLDFPMLSTEGSRLRRVGMSAECAWHCAPFFTYVLQQVVALHSRASVEEEGHLGMISILSFAILQCVCTVLRPNRAEMCWFRDALARSTT